MPSTGIWRRTLQSRQWAVRYRGFQAPCSKLPLGPGVEEVREVAGRLILLDRRIMARMPQHDPDHGWRDHPIHGFHLAFSGGSGHAFFIPEEERESKA